MGVDDDFVAMLIEEAQKQSAGDLHAARLEDSERLDNMIHGIVTRTQNPEFKARLEGLDREIHRVFEAAAAVNPELADTLELVEGIVVLSSVMDEIADARLGGGAAPSGGDPQSDLAAARLSDSKRLDNMIHAIISNTPDPAFKARLEGLDSEIHRVFEAAAVAVPEGAELLQLMEGIVVLSSIMDEVANVRLAGQPMDQAASLSPVISVSGEGSEVTVLGAGFAPGERVILNVAHTAFAQVIRGGDDLLEAQFSANETGAFSVTGTLPLGPGVYSLVATGADSRKTAVVPVVIQ